MSNFVKLYGSILDSTVWQESLPTKVVWITMLAMADAEGFVAASVPGLTKRAGVTRAQCESAIRVLSEPDPDSKTTDHEGRRIEAVDGGWVILNHRKYRDLRTDTQIATAERVRKHRERQKESVTVTDVTDGNDEQRAVRAEEEEEAYTEADTSIHLPAIAVAAFISELPANQNALHWHSIIAGWMQGLGFEGGKCATDEDIATGLTEYLATAKRDFAVIHVRSFVERARRNRLKSAARPASNGKGTEEATRIWTLIKSQGIHHMATSQERWKAVAALVEKGAIKNANTFIELFDKCDRKTLLKAETDAFAIRHIAERLNGSAGAIL